MKLLIDTNVVLDLLLNIEPFCNEAAKVLNLSDRAEVKEYISASAITDIYYIAYRQLRDKTIVRNMIKTLLSIVSIACVTEQEIAEALELEWSDFEDSVQYAVAYLNEMDGIVTRNAADYKRAELSVWSPEQIVKKLELERG